MTKLLFLDTETGGLNPDFHSLLSVGLVAWEDFKIIDKKEILLKEEHFKVNSSAMEVNGIDLEEHKKNAVEYNEGVKLINEFCKNNFEIPPTITLVGHNINFDISFLKKLYKNSEIPYEQLFSHRTIDTSSILKYLYMTGNFDEDISSSDKAFNYFNIVASKRHSALSDAVATTELFEQLLKIYLKKD
ncbi:3'-5' exonuclease [bacterium]|nr:3'-5' exonuclease [bacterium]